MVLTYEEKENLKLHVGFNLSLKLPKFN